MAETIYVIRQKVLYFLRWMTDTPCFCDLANVYIFLFVLMLALEFILEFVFLVVLDFGMLELFIQFL